MKKHIYNYSLSLVVSLLSFISFAQPGNGCADAVPVPTLDGTNCPTQTSSLTNSLAAGPCEEGLNDTWFSFVAQGSTADFTVSGPGGFRPEYLILSEPTNGCGGPFTIEDCADANGNYSGLTGTTNGLIPGNTYWVVVSSGNGSFGNITVCIDNPATIANCVDNETCATAQTITLNASGGAQACVTDCNTGASNGLDFTGNVCADQTNPVSWFEFTTDAAAASVTIDLSSLALTNPEFTVFLGNACIGPYTITNCTEGAAGNATATFNVATNQTYTIAVSDQLGATGDYTLCIEQDPDNSACNTNNNYTVTSTSLGSPTGGPYEPGEDVTICYNVIDFQQVNCNYIGAFIPTFGDCWDPSSFDAQGQPVNITTPLPVNGVIQNVAGNFPCEGAPSGTWQWFTAGQVTYNNLAGGFYPANSPLPAGWYFLSSYNPGTSIDCTPVTDPNFTFGDGNYPSCVNTPFDYTICFTLKVKPMTEVCTNGQTNCDVTFKTLADAEFGAWTNIGCTVDGASTANSSAICTLPIELEYFNASYSPSSNSVVLTWATASEIDNDYFNVERSNDGITFETVATVQANGNSTSEIRYSAIDENPKLGYNFYRLKQVDFDGQYALSNIEPINIVSDNYHMLSIAPNPSNGLTEVLYNAYSKEDVQVTITDYNGTNVLETSFKTILGSNRFKIDMSGNAKGVYIVKVVSSTGTNTTKMVIK